MPAAAKEEEIQKRKITRQDLLAEKLLSAALVKNNFAILDDSADFLKPPQREILRIFKTGKRQSEDPSLDAAIGVIVLSASEDLPIEEIASLKAELAKEYYKERRQIVTQAIKNAELHGNEAELKAALEELSQLPTVTNE